MLRTFIVISLAALVCQAYPSDSDRVTELYSTVVAGDLDTAFNQAKTFVSQGKGHLITQTVDKLTKNSVRNTLEFAYKLWSHGSKDIVRERFPIQFRMLMAEDKVKIIFNRDNLAMKLGEAVDDAGDRVAYGDVNDKSSERVSWKFLPLWEDNRVYFKIFYVQRNQYLKLGVKEDDAGDHNVYGDSVTNTQRHQFYLQPAYLHGNVVFYIFNREYQQALKLGRALDSQGDRQVFSHKGSVVGSPDLWAWHILPY